MINNNPSKIPNSLRNASSNFPYIAESVDIYDKNSEKSQEQVNASVQETLVDHQNQINALDSQNFLSYVAEDGDTLADILPATGEVNTIYRVGSWDYTLNDGTGGYDETKYSEYAWDGTQYKPMDVKDMQLGSAEDFENPDAEKRSKVPTVGAVADVFGSYTENPEWIDVKTDSEGKVLEGTTSDNVKVITGDAVIKGTLKVEGTEEENPESDAHLEANSISIDGNIISSINNPEYTKATIDSKERVLDGITKDGRREIYTPIDTPAVSIDFFENPEWFEVKTDNKGRILEGITNEWVKRTNIPFDTPYIRMSPDEDQEKRICILVDKEGRIISYRDLKGLCFENAGIETPYFKTNDIYFRNQHKEASLFNACRHSTDGRHDLQLCVVNDSHTDDVAMSHAVEITNRFSTIDGMVHCGDIVLEGYTPDYIQHFFSEIMSRCKKPWFITVGNHDCGQTVYVNHGATHEDVYNSFIKPMVNAGNLREGEYEAGKSYYYHDFINNKIRLIVTYDSDAPIDSADDLWESNYWEPVAYDSSYPQIKDNYDYVYDENNPVFVNCGNYKAFSFRLKQSVHTTSGQWSKDTDVNNGWTRPAFKIARGARVIRKEQADWFINTLASTPAGYGVIVASHVPISLYLELQTNKKFSTKLFESYIYGENAINNLIGLKTDMVCDVIQAFIDKTTLDENVVMRKDGWPNPNGTSDATYMNVNVDPNGGENFAYSISADFTNVSSECYFIGFVEGHHHLDMVYRHQNYPQQWAVIGPTPNQHYGTEGDISRGGNSWDSVAYDNVNVISFAKNRIAIVRIGNDETTYGEKRDFEVINTNEN